MKDVNILINAGVDVKKSLELFGDMETYNETLETFLQEIEPKLQKIKEFKEIGDMANYAILVHSLKSDARYFGFDNLADIAYKHELESKANHMYFVTENYDELITEARKIVNLVKKYFGREYAEEQINVEVKAKDKAILVVDDSNIIRSFINKIFKDDYDVIIANDGKEALNIIDNPDERKRIKAMLLDLNMPNVDGFEVLDIFQQKDLFKTIPVSIITGVDDKESVAKAFKYPIVDMLTKPFNERDVKAILEKTLNSIL